VAIELSALDACCPVSEGNEWWGDQVGLEVRSLVLSISCCARFTLANEITKVTRSMRQAISTRNCFQKVYKGLRRTVRCSLDL
jgi:hypothetical protein